MKIVDIRIKHYETSYKVKTTSHAVSSSKREIKDLHKTHLFVPADKAVNNIKIVCRKCYIEVLRNKIHSSNTFQATRLTEQKIVNETS